MSLCQNHCILFNKATKLINKRTFRIQIIPFIVHVCKKFNLCILSYIKRFINLKLSKILCNICVNNLKSPVISNTRSIRKNSFMRSLHFLPVTIQNHVYIKCFTNILLFNGRHNNRKISNHAFIAYSCCLQDKQIKIIIYIWVKLP